MEPLQQGSNAIPFLHESKHCTGPRIQLLNRSLSKSRKQNKTTQNLRNSLLVFLSKKYMIMGEDKTVHIRLWSLP